jgi:predicted phage baseplate assembly protein
MPLEDWSPNLDDRTAEDIVEEVKLRIPRYTQEWTDWNEHDPGITLIQLFAWMTELIIYRLNQVPDKNFIEFLRLVGVELKPAAPAKADLTFTLQAGSKSAIIPKGTPVGLEGDDEEEPIIFETDESLVASEVIQKCIQTYDGSTYSVNTGANDVVGQNYYAFGQKALIESALYLGFDQSLPTEEVKLSICLYTEDLIAEGSHCELKEANIHPPADVVWEYWNGITWRDLDILKDKTRSLTKSGSFYFKGPSNAQKSIEGQSQEELYWIRCRIIESGYEVSPRIDTILMNTVTASNVVTVKGEIVGESDGKPNQTYKLRHTPVIAASLILQIQESEEKGWKTWKEVSDFAASTRHDEHYVLNRLTGGITFGDGKYGKIPLPLSGGNNIMALEYEYGGGKKANVGAGKLTALQTSVPSVDSVTNKRPATGGEDEETLEAAKQRGPEELKTSQRAVTIEDFEFLATQTPGVRVRRAKCLPLHHPDFPAGCIPGVVTVIIVPESQESKPMPSEGMIETVCEHLNKHRLLTSEVYVKPPQYVKVKVAAEVIVKPDADSAALENALRDNLDNFFHPLKGGLDKKGWPFGGDIYYSDVYQVVLNTPGIDRVETVDIYLDDEKQDTCKNVVIPGNCLLYSDGHDLDAHYERG